MSSRAQRRQAARQAVAKGSEDAADLITQLNEDRDRLKDYCRSYKTRLEYMARNMQMISRCLLNNDIHAAVQFINAIGKTTLAEARDAVGRREQALDIAIKVLQTPAVHDVGNALAQMRALVPDAFGEGEEVLVAAGPVASA